MSFADQAVPEIGQAAVDQILRALHAPAENPCRLRHWIALKVQHHRQPPFATPFIDQDGQTDLDTAERWSEEELSLPMFAELSPQEVVAVTDAMQDAIAEVHG